MEVQQSLRPGRLLVITEVDADPGSSSTRNRSLNVILDKYAEIFDTVAVWAPLYKGELPSRKSLVHFYATPDYSKRPIDRLAFLIRRRKRSQEIARMAAMVKPEVIQIRVPSIFALAYWPQVLKLGIPVTSYVAGDWGEAFKNNSPALGWTRFGCFLDFVMRKVIDKTFPVFAGPVLRAKFSDPSKSAHTYFSTTHETVVSKGKDIAPHRPIRCLFVGRIEPLKRVEDAIGAVERLVSSHALDAHLDVVGGGSVRQTEQLENLTDRLGLRERICFHGVVSEQKKLDDLFAESDFLVFPSLAEGTPKVLAEAMAYGLVPVAVRGVGSIPSIVHDRKNGRLVPPRSPAEIATAIAELVQSPSMYAELSREAIRYAQQHTLSREVDGLWTSVFRDLHTLNGVVEE